MEVNIHHAKTNLSQLILKAESGEEVIIARAGKPVVRLVALQTKPVKRKPGALKGILKIAPDAFSPEVDEEIARSFYENPLPLTDADMKMLKHKLTEKLGKRKKK